MSTDPTSILSREELGALLETAREGALAHAVRESGLGENARGELRELATRFAEEQGRGLSTLYQTPIHLRLAHVEEITLRHFAAPMLPTDRVARLELGAGIEAYLLLSRPLVFAWMSIAFGARPSSDPPFLPPRPYTRIEQRFLTRAAESVAGTLAKAMDRSASDARVAALEDPLALYDRSKRPYRVLSIAVAGLGEESMLRVALPSTVVDEAAPDLPASVGEPSGAMAGQLLETAVELRAQLGRAELTLQELSRLSVGDELRLEPVEGGAGLLVRVEGEPRFRAETGTLGQRLAIRITERIGS